MRLIVSPRHLVVVESRRHLQRPGPHGAALERVCRGGVAVADLERVDEDELVVGFVTGSPDTPEIRERVAAWAQLVGFRRLWFPDELLALDPVEAELGEARVRCPTCSARFAERDADFWAMVRSNKLFPNRCLVCGAPLPQWEVEAAWDGAADPVAAEAVRT